MDKIVGILPPGALVILGIVLLARWIGADATDVRTLRVAGMDGDGLGVGDDEDGAEAVTLEAIGEPIRGNGLPSDLAGACARRIKGSDRMRRFFA